MIRLFQTVILVLSLSLIALASAIVTMRFAIHGAEVTLPSFKGLTTEDALERAASLGLATTVDNRFYSAEVPSGRILSQSPAAGTVVRREWQVRLAESLGPQLMAIPNLVGREQRGATIELRRRGLDLGSVVHLPTDLTAPGAIVAQQPAAGAAGVERPIVSVVIAAPASAQQAAFVMPDLTGQLYATAAATITRAGLRLAPAVTSTTPANYPSGAVVSQTPLAGYRVDATTPIELTLAR